MQGRIGRMASDNERLYSANQRLIEANELSDVDPNNLQVGQEQLDLAMTRLDRHSGE
jgi:hypothetical protein